MKNRPFFFAWSADRKRLTTGLLLLLLGLSALHAEISNDVWKVLTNLSVTLEKNDGSEVAGKLTSVTDKAVVVSKPSGRAVTVMKDDIQNVRLSLASEESAAEVSNDVWKALIHQNLVLEKSDGSEVAGQLDSVADDTVVIVKANGRAVSISRDDVQSVRLPVKSSGNVPPASDGSASGFSVGVGGAQGIGQFSSYPHFKGQLSGTSVEVKESVTPTDIMAFFDATYLQASVGYMFINGGSITMKAGGSSSTSSVSGSLSYVTFALYGKLPLAIGPVRVFPLLGFQYRLNLTYTDADGNDLKPALTSQELADLNELWIEGGAGVDIVFGRFYIRAELLLGVKPLSTTDNNALSASEALGYSNPSMRYSTFDIGVLAGYRL